MSTLLVMAGGTGGHVYPALAVAREVARRGVNVVWLGTQSGLEARLVPEAGFDIEWVNIKGLRGHGWRGLVRTPFLLILAVAQTVRVIFHHRPSAVLGMGGFAAGPGGLAAWLLRTPLIIHESNAVAGLTNKWLARIAQHVLTGFPDTLKHLRHQRWVGNPVRSDINTMQSPTTRLAQHSGPIRLLVLGGSLGAQAFNQQLPAMLDRLNQAHPIVIRHQSGLGKLKELQAAYSGLSLEVETTDYIKDMAAAYDWADLVICRAGAMTVAELCAAGIAAILVPYPYAAGDHQLINAQYLFSKKAALLLNQNEFEPDILLKLLAGEISQRQSLQALGESARRLAKPHATTDVADCCMEYCCA